jgi:pimeloyl-ACP methyl ester carboxylesterase
MATSGGRTAITALAALTVIATAGTSSTADTQPTPTASASSAHASPLFPCPSPTRTKPTIVLIHGAWADTSSWAAELSSLQRAGYVARAVANPLRDLTTDAASVADFLRTISGPIVVVGHSYGGSVATNAAAGNPNVKALVYVDAAAPDVGETTGQLSGSGSALAKNPGSLYDKVSSPDAPREPLTCTSSGRPSSVRSPPTCPVTRRYGCGRPSDRPRPPPSRRPRRRRHGGRSRPGTSSAPETASSPRPRSCPWPAGHTRRSSNSAADPT